MFHEAFTLGPPPQRFEESRATAKAAFEQRQAWLRTDGEKLFGKEEAQRLLAETPENYAERQVGSIAAMCKACSSPSIANGESGPMITAVIGDT